MYQIISVSFKSGITLEGHECNSIRLALGRNYFITFSVKFSMQFN